MGSIGSSNKISNIILKCLKIITNFEDFGRDFDIQYFSFSLNLHHNNSLYNFEDCFVRRKMAQILDYCCYDYWYSYDLLADVSSLEYSRNVVFL